MKGYNGEEKLEVINGEPKEALISAKSSEKELTFEMNVINNYENSLEEVVVLGRTMFKGNKDIATMLNMGTTIDIPLSSKITITGIPEENVQIYYSTNGDATTDLTNANNLWEKEITDYATIKSYMIVLKDYSMEMGDTFKFTYTATVPANLDYNNTAYETYGVYFKNNKETVIIDDKTFATKIGINTGKMATLEAKIIPKLDDGKEIKAGESLDYTISIKNFGTIDAEDATININIPENVEFIPQEGDSYRIKTIMPRQKFEILEEPELTEEDIDNNPDLTEEQKQEQKENLRQYREAMEEQKKQIEEYEKMIKEMEAEGIEFDENITETKNILIIDIYLPENLSIKYPFHYFSSCKKRPGLPRAFPYIFYSISVTSTLNISITFCISYTFAYSLQECTLFMEFAMTKPLIPCWLNTLLSLPPKVLISFGSTSHRPQAATYRLMMDSDVAVSYACMSICCVQSMVAPYFSALFWKAF
mgnify:CR=1 FL=1